MNKTALYSRVSTLEQAREGYSIHAQKERLEAYAVAKGLDNPEHYSDPGISGSTTNRPELQRMIKDIKDKKVSHVIVYKLDRLSRSQRDTLSLVQDLFNMYDVKFISLEESIDTGTPMGIAMIGVLSAFAELERSTFKVRSLMGREERAKKGLYHGGGNYDPLGYTYEDGKLIIDPYEAKIVKEMYDLYVSGNSMNTVSEKMKAKYPDRVKSFTLVKGVLTHALYVGKVTFNGNTYDGEHEAIIDENTWRKAQQIRKSRAVGATKTNKRKGLLLGKVYCARCGARLQRVVSGSRKYRYVYYKCYSQNRSRSTANMIKDRNCKLPAQQAEKLEELVLNHLKGLEFENFETKENDKNVQISNRENQIKKLQSQSERIMDLYTLGMIDVEAVKDKNAPILKRIEVLQDEIEELSVTHDVDEAQDTLANFDWENASKEEQIILVDTLVDRIEVDSDDVRIYLSF